jgi:hypothetical protein
MDLVGLWFQFKGFFVDIVKYGFPTVALGLSIISFAESRKANKVKDRLNDLRKGSKSIA